MCTIFIRPNTYMASVTIQAPPAASIKAHQQPTTSHEKKKKNCHDHHESSSYIYRLCVAHAALIFRSLSTLSCEPRIKFNTIFLLASLTWDEWVKTKRVTQIPKHFQTKWMKKWTQTTTAIRSTRVRDRGRQWQNAKLRTRVHVL